MTSSKSSSSKSSSSKSSASSNSSIKSFIKVEIENALKKFVVQDITSIKNDISGLKNDISGLKNDMKTVKIDIASLVDWRHKISTIAENKTNLYFETQYRNLRPSCLIERSYIRNFYEPGVNTPLTDIDGCF